MKHVPFHFFYIFHVQSSALPSFPVFINCFSLLYSCINLKLFHLSWLLIVPLSSATSSILRSEIPFLGYCSPLHTFSGQSGQPIINSDRVFLWSSFFFFFTITCLETIPKWVSAWFEHHVCHDAPIPSVSSHWKCLSLKCHWHFPSILYISCSIVCYLKFWDYSYITCP